MFSEGQSVSFFFLKESSGCVLIPVDFLLVLASVQQVE